MPSRFAVIALAAASVYGASTPAPSVSRAGALLRSMPVRFEENRGQFDPRVKFVARTGQYNLSLTADGAVIATGEKGRTKQIAISFPGSKPGGVEGADAYPFRTNYFLGNNRASWRTGVANYARVRYREVYPGVDVVYYGNGEQLEYDFALKPGADPKLIRMDFRGADRVSLAANGDLAIEAGSTRVMQKRPFVYQQDAGARREVAAHYKLLEANMVGVEVGPYDRKKALTIDPVLYYGTLVGTSGMDSVVSVKADAAGYVYVLGTMTQGDFGPWGFYQIASAGGSDVFLAKFDPNLDGPSSLAYFTYIGGTGDDKAGRLAVDNSGNAYITGSTVSTDFPVTATAYQSKRAGNDVANQDAFVVKLNTFTVGSGALLYSTYFGGSGDELSQAIAIDHLGTIYFGGWTRSSDMPKTTNTRVPSIWGSQDGFVARIDPAQSGTACMLYSAFIGSAVGNIDEVVAITVAPDATVSFAGNAGSGTFAQAGSYAFGPRGSIDIFVARLNVNQAGFETVPYLTMFGGSGVDQVKDMVADPTGKLLLTGYTLSPDFTTSPGAMATAPLGTDGNAFVARLDLSKPDIVDYSTYLGGSVGEVGYGVASGPGGTILVTGYTLSPDFPTSPDAHQKFYTGGVNGFFTVVDPALPVVKYSTFLGGTGVHTGRSVAASANGRMYVSGSAAPAKGDVGTRGLKADYTGGLNDGFLLVFAP